MSIREFEVYWQKILEKIKAEGWTEKTTFYHKVERLIMAISSPPTIPKTYEESFRFKCRDIHKDAYKDCRMMGFIDEYPFDDLMVENFIGSMYKLEE